MIDAAIALEARARQSIQDATGLTAAATGAIASRFGLELIHGGDDSEEVAEESEVEPPTEDDD